MDHAEIGGFYSYPITSHFIYMANSTSLLILSDVRFEQTIPMVLL